MSGIGFADYVNIALSADNLALRTDLFDSRLHFHKELYSSSNPLFCLEALDNPGFSAVGLELEEDFVPY
jgi:hypothetical protein